MNETACVSGVDLLMDYLEDALAPELRAALDEHVAGCERCVAFIESYRATPRILREATSRRITGEVEQALRAFLRSRRILPPSDN